jgi:tRNA(adenine34) deaminase
VPAPSAGLLSNTACQEKFLAAGDKSRLHTGEGMAMPEFSQADERHMRLALRLAEDAARKGDVPIGAVVARGGEVLGSAGNERELRGDPTAHAEVLALRQASERLGGWRLLETTIYVTLEPCPMCAAALSFARIRRLYFGAGDPKGGAVEHGVRFFASNTCHHRPDLYGGIGERDAAALLREFFAARR